MGAVLEYHFSKTIKTETENLWSKDIIDQLSKSFYVDNCVTSVGSESVLKLFIEQAKEIMARGCFELRGWEHGVKKTRCVLAHPKNQPMAC